MLSIKNKLNLYVLPRWAPVLGGLLTSTTCGMLLYAFSVFINPINLEFGWSRSTISLAFSICCLCNGMMAFIAGRLTDKFGPKYIVIFGGFLTSLGFFLSSFITTPLQLYITYGIMAGIGSSLIYLPPIITVPKWWPNRPALVTGIVVSGLGLGAFFMAPLSTYIIENHGWRSVFSIGGVCMGVMTIIAGFIITNPTENLCSNNKSSSVRKIISFSYSEAIKTKQFWFLYISFFFAATAGLMIIGHIAAHGRDQGLNYMDAAWAVSAFAIANGLTRILSGIIVDKIKLKNYFAFLLMLQTLAILLLYPAGNNFLFLFIVAIVIGWNYGAMFMLFPVMTLNFFGSNSQGSIYGLLFTSYGFAGFIGPWLGGLVKDISGTYLTAFLLSATIVAISSFIICFMKSPIRK